MLVRQGKGVEHHNAGVWADGWVRSSRLRGGKVAKLKDLGEDETWEKELTALEAEVDRLQLKVDAQEESCSADAAPGANIDLVPTLTWRQLRLGPTPTWCQLRLGANSDLAPTST